MWKFSRRKNHGRICGIFCLQNQQTIFFQHTFEGGCFVVDDDNGNVAGFHIILFADKDKVVGIDARIDHTVPLDTKIEIFMAG